MRILIDIVHTADINFWKKAVEEMSKKGHKVSFTVLRRGNLLEIAKKEYANYEIIPLGTHRTNFIGKIWSITMRELGFLSLYLRRRFDVVTSFGFYPGFLARPLGMRAVHFHDDKEYRQNYLCSRLFASKFISFCEAKESKKVKVVNTYKELTYLYDNIKTDTKYFDKLGIKKEKYIYVRDISNISLNYSDNKLISYDNLFDAARKKGYKIVYDSESGKVPYDNVISFEGIHTFEEMIAIKKYAALVITSGDTVLREAALLGTPVIYTSPREMSINKKLNKIGLFETCLNSESLVKKGLKMLNPKTKANMIKKASAHIKTCEDATKIILKELLN